MSAAQGLAGEIRQAQIMADTARADAALDREICLAAIERRFGWLRKELAQHGGNLSELPSYQQTLWHGREKVIAAYNHAGEIPDSIRRTRAYQKITRGLGR